MIEVGSPISVISCVVQTKFLISSMFRSFQPNSVLNCGFCSTTKLQSLQLVWYEPLLHVSSYHSRHNEFLVMLFCWCTEYALDFAFAMQCALSRGQAHKTAVLQCARLIVLAQNKWVFSILSTASCVLISQPHFKKFPFIRNFLTLNPRIQKQDL